jgi:Na+(H+)/acetate symporter ActP
VSGLIVAPSGTIEHDFIDKYLQIGMTDKTKVIAEITAAIDVGIFTILLGILFNGINDNSTKDLVND